MGNEFLEGFMWGGIANIAFPFVVGGALLAVGLWWVNQAPVKTANVSRLIRYRSLNF